MQDKVKLNEQELLNVAGGTNGTDELFNHCDSYNDGRENAKKECKADPKCKWLKASYYYDPSCGVR